MVMVLNGTEKKTKAVLSIWEGERLGDRRTGTERDGFSVYMSVSVCRHTCIPIHIYIYTYVYLYLYV